MLRGAAFVAPAGLCDAWSCRRSALPARRRVTPVSPPSFFLRTPRKLPQIALRCEKAASVPAYAGALDNAAEFIPTWTKVAVALARGLGTVAGWKRIVATVGEKIEETHLGYAQGASARLAATPFGILRHVV